MSHGNLSVPPAGKAFLKSMCGVAVMLSLCFALSAPAVLAQTSTQPDPQAELTPAAALARLFTAETWEEGWFTPEVLAQVPIAQLQMIVGQIASGLGEFLGVEGSGTQYQVVFTEGSVPTTIVLDTQGRIAGLWFSAPRPRVSGLDDALAPFAVLPGRVSVLVVRDGAELASLNPDEPLAVGSAFKLAVLAALSDEIATGRRAWSDVVELQENWRSLPSGILQDWPAGSPLTLHTLAALMISVSDNTATDALIHTLGREAVEAFAPRNRPLLTTREAFILKNPGNTDLLEQYRAADEAGRRAVLAEAAERAMANPEAFVSPRALDVEWFFTTRELCTLMGAVEGLPLMSINPGVANPAEWERVGFKGGSEPGVLNLTTGLVDASGHTYCVSATWNHTEALDQGTFFRLYAGVLEGLKQLAGTR